MIKSLRDSGVIGEAKFAFYLDAESDLSYIDVGYFREDGMRDPTNLKMINILSGNYWWAQSVSAIKFG